ADHSKCSWFQRSEGDRTGRDGSKPRVNARQASMRRKKDPARHQETIKIGRSSVPCIGSWAVVVSCSPFLHPRRRAACRESDCSSARAATERVRVLAALVLAAALTGPAGADSSARNAAHRTSRAPGDSLTPGTHLPRVVKLAETLVQATRIHDPFSTETVQLIPASVAHTLPVDRVSELLALQAGVVARGEDLHVRG